MLGQNFDRGEKNFWRTYKPDSHGGWETW